MPSDIINQYTLQSIYTLKFKTMGFERIDNQKKATGGYVRKGPFDDKSALIVQSGSALRLMPLALAALGLTEDSRVQIGKVGEKDGVAQYGLAVSAEGRKPDEMGRFSSQAAATQLGGGNVYEVGEKVTEADGSEYFPLTQIGQVKLQSRNKAEGTTAIKAVNDADASVAGSATPAVTEDASAPTDSTPVNESADEDEY